MHTWRNPIPNKMLNVYVYTWLWSTRKIIAGKFICKNMTNMETCTCSMAEAVDTLTSWTCWGMVDEWWWMIPLTLGWWDLLYKTTIDSEKSDIIKYQGSSLCPSLPPTHTRQEERIQGPTRKDFPPTDLSLFSKVNSTDDNCGRALWSTNSHHRGQLHQNPLSAQAHSPDLVFSIFIGFEVQFAHTNRSKVMEHTNNVWVRD